MRYGTKTLMHYLNTLAIRCDLKGVDVFSELRGLCEDLEEGFADLQRQINELKGGAIVAGCGAPFEALGLGKCDSCGELKAGVAHKGICTECQIWMSTLLWNKAVDTPAPAVHQAPAPIGPAAARTDPLYPSDIPF